MVWSLTLDERLVTENAVQGGRFADLVVALCASDLFLGQSKPSTVSSQ